MVLISEEGKVAMSDIADINRRLKQQQNMLDEWAQRVEEVAKQTSIRVDENRTGQQEANVLRQEAEMRIFAAIREETRLREEQMARERKDREAACAELAERVKKLFEEE